MHLWILSNPDLTNQLLVAQDARTEAMARAGYLFTTALERAVVGAGDALVSGVSALKAAIVQGRRRRQAINALQALDNRLLADIGISRGEIVELVDGALERGPLTLAELRGLPRPVPSVASNEPAKAAPRRTPVGELPKAA